MEQITIFDFVAPEIPDFHNLTEEQIVNVIADAVGLDFKKRDFGRFVAYEAAYKNSVIDVYVSHYTCYDREGEPFISCGFWNKKMLSGASIPADSLQEAIQFFKKHK